MDEHDEKEVAFRKLQEQSAQIIGAGMHNEIVKWHKALYDAYVAAGFSEQQALELVKANIK